MTGKTDTHPAACPACGRNHYVLVGGNRGWRFRHECDVIDMQIECQSREAVVGMWNHFAKGKQ